MEKIEGKKNSFLNFLTIFKELIKTTEATIATKRHEHEMLTAAAKLTEKKNRKFMKDVKGRTTGTLLAAATKLQVNFYKIEALIFL